MRATVGAVSYTHLDVYKRQPVTSGPLTIVGSLAPSESPTSAKKSLGPNEIGSIDVPALLNKWGGDVYNGFLFAVSETCLLYTSRCV